MKSPIKRKSAAANNQKNGDYSLAHVLYQKLGNDWYAFTEVDGDCFMSKVNEDEASAPTHQQSDDQHADDRNSRRRRAA